MKSSLTIVLMLLASSSVEAQSLTTLFDTDNGHEGNMFDLFAKKDLVVNSFDVNFTDDWSPAPCGSTCSVVEVEAYYTVLANTSYQVAAGDFDDWTLAGSVQHTVTTGYGEGQPLNLAMDVPILANQTRGFYITSSGPTNSLTGEPNAGIRYTTYGPSPAGGEYPPQNEDILAGGGAGCGYPFAGWQIANPRMWSGTVYYSTLACASPYESYCTAGTTAEGCQATLSSAGVARPDARGVAFRVFASGVPAQRDGLFFFGQNGRQATPWGNSSSFQCVAPPVNRGGLLISGGTAGFCNGNFGQDLNARWCPACPNPVQAPVVGTKLQVQFWYRDPQNTSNQTTSLSNAIEVDVCP